MLIRALRKWKLEARSGGMTGPNLGQNAPFFVDNEVIVLTRNGVWIADGSEITHEPTRRLFARSLRRDPDGYRLYIGRETKKIEVEDTAYFVTRVDVSDESVELWINDETRERLDPRSLAYRPGRLACRIKGGAEEAKFLHAAYFDLLRELQEDSRGYFLMLGGERVELAKK
jgi:hypothetical protein